jgi:hypothetical protein
MLLLYRDSDGTANYFNYSYYNHSLLTIALITSTNYIDSFSRSLV